ncbi:hypothetical protein G6F43_010743 [Rhizopus delemar]|nr:hypothetical protein G6F43_010743 [Rhizopus delemar]
MAREIADESEQLMKRRLKASQEEGEEQNDQALSHNKSDALWPAQQAVATYLRSKGHKAIFFIGEEELRSTTDELEKEDKTDDRYKYYTDGVLQRATMNS